MKRTSVVRLIVDKSSEEKLKLLCNLSSKLWNEVNYARRRMFFEKRGVDIKATYKEFYEKYKVLIGSATTQQILNKNDEAWKSFFKMLKLKKEDKLPPFITKINPPGYKKKNNKRSLWIVLRKDQYKIKDDKIVLKGLGVIGKIELRYEGLVHLKGEQGRLEIHYDPDRKRWYAHISFEVSEKAVRRVWTSVPKKPRGDLVVGIDVGTNNLMAIYVENGLTQLVNGKPLKAISHYWRLRIAEYQSMLNKYGLKTSRRLRTMYSKWRRQIKSYVDSGVRQAIEWLYNIGVSTIKVGYPKNIAQENGDFNNVHVWTYGYLLRRIYEVAEEHGITAVYVSEAYTSSRCPIHKKKCGKRVKRGLFKCTRLNKVFNADLVGAYNILITPSPDWDRGNGPETRPETKPSRRGDVVPNLPALAGTFALQGGEEVRVGTGIGENPDLKTLVLEGKVERKKIDIEPKEDLAAILYTGGTTGMPKGVMLTHYNLLSNAIQLMVASSFSHRDTILGSMPLFHSAEFGLFNITMISGATYVLMGRFDPALVAENIEKYGATFSWAVPPAFNALVYYLEDPKTRQYNWKNLKAFATGAWPVAPAMIERFKKIVAEKCNNPRVAHNQVWGMTEASPMCTTNPHLRLDKSYTQGIPLPDVELKLIDPETGKEIKEPNITGEAVLRGPNVFKGYWKRPEEDRNAWWIDPKTGLRYFRTGDLGYIDPEGFFVFQDRLKEVIKYKGYTIAPFELEALLLKHEAVKDVAVIGKPDPEAGEIPKAFVVLKPEYKNKITAKEIIEWCRERISGYKRIREVEFVEEIPRTPSGKILRRVLRELEKRKKD